jgi:hypothetical protein
MNPFHGKLLRDGQVVVDGIDGRLTIDYTPTHTELWSGFFTVPAGQTVQLNDRFDLVLDDGRTGKIRIERVNVTGQGSFASFAAA